MTLEPKEAIKRLLDGEVLEVAPMNHDSYDRHSIETVMSWELGWLIRAKYRTIETEEASC